MEFRGFGYVQYEWCASRLSVCAFIRSGHRQTAGKTTVGTLSNVGCLGVVAAAADDDDDVLAVKPVRAVREHRSTTPLNGSVDVANGDDDAASCGHSTPGGSKQCGGGGVAVATVAVPPPAYDLVVESGADDSCTATRAEQQVRAIHWQY